MKNARATRVGEARTQNTLSTSWIGESRGGNAHGTADRSSGDGLRG